MASVFAKLNLKNGREIVVINAPESFEAELATLEDVSVLRDFAEAQQVDFALAFVTKQAELDALTDAVAPKAVGDAIIWFAYPKGTSKHYHCEFNRDTGWERLGQHGFEPVRQVAIDEDWSALRFRRAQFIKTMTRNKQRALSDQGRARVTDLE